MYNSYSTPTQDPAAHSDWVPKTKKKSGLARLFSIKNPIAVLVALVGLFSIVGVTLAAVVIPYVTKTGRYSSTPKQSSASVATSCRTSFDVAAVQAWGCQSIVPVAQPTPSGYIASYKYQCNANQTGATYYFFAIRRSQNAAFELLGQGSTSNVSDVVNIRDGEYVEVQCNPFRNSEGSSSESVNANCTSKMQLFSDSIPTPSPTISYRCNTACTTATQCSSSLGSNYTCYNGACRLIGNETSTTCVYSCNSACTATPQCNPANPTSTQFVCYNGQCRLGTNPGSGTCSNPSPTPSPSPSPTPIYACNSACTTVAQCQGNLGNTYTCYGGFCRLGANPTSATCAPLPPITYSCNSTCTTGTVGNTQCQSSLGSAYSCYNGQCRLTSNPTSSVCAPTPPPVTYSCNSTCTTGTVGNTQCQSSLGSAYSCYNGQCRLTSNPTSTVCAVAQVCQSPIKKDTGNYCKQKTDGTKQNYVTFQWYRQQSVNQYEIDIEKLNTSTNTFSLFINNGWRNRSAFGSDCTFATNYSEHCEYSVYLAPGTYRAKVRTRGTTAPICTETPYVSTDPITLGSCQ